ncbi:MAG TPA: glycosyltransferase [Bryobacteraceae bacterium]|nr:glycosyltransferase [Bryobacteraceae bacterium]
MSSVDIIVPCYKYGHYLRQCVESVLSQEGVEVRVLIIDDASPDDSALIAAQLAKEDPRVHFVHHRENRGHIATFNEGIEWVSGDYMLLLSADDYLLPGALGRAVALMDKRPDIAFVFGRAQELYPNGRTVDVFTDIARYDKLSSSVIPGLEFIEVSLSRNRVPTPTTVVRTSIAKQVGGYRVELPHTGDMEMWLRLAARGAVGMIGERQAVYRRHNTNMSSGYARPHWSDLQERHAALESFLTSSGDLLPSMATVRSNMQQELCAEAMRRSRWAFDEGEYQTSLHLRQYAQKLYPRIFASAEWIKLVIKQLLGPAAVNALRSVLPSR